MTVSRCPNNVLDFYCALKHVASHASELGVDPARIAMAGESGGGYICAGAMVGYSPVSLSDTSRFVAPAANNPSNPPCEV